jgi:tetratricopeptide (TPR) repeat protein
VDADRERVEREARRAAETQALALLSGARDLYDQGDYPAAIVLLERAYQLTGHSRYLFNLGASHHGAGHCDVARGYYESYLRREPRGSRRPAASAALGEIYAECGRAPGPDRARRVAAWSFLGAGAAVGLASLTSLVLMRETQAELDARVAAAALPDGRWGPEGNRLLVNGTRYQSYAVWLGVSSGLLLAAGATLFVLDGGEQGRVTLSPAAFPGLSYSRNF